MILDLSSPEGCSVNDGIDPALCSLTYPSVRDAITEIAHLGKGALLAKVDSCSLILPFHLACVLLLKSSTAWQIPLNGCLRKEVYPL